MKGPNATAGTSSFEQNRFARGNTYPRFLSAKMRRKFAGKENYSMTSDEKEIRELVATWMAATKSGDTEKVLGLMTEDAVFLVPGQPPMKKADFAKKASAQAEKAAPTFDGTSEVQEIIVTGDWAFMWTKLRVIATPPNGAAPTVRAGHTLSVLRKQGGRWLLARDANLLVPEKNATTRE